MLFTATDNLHYLKNLLALLLCRSPQVRSIYSHCIGEKREFGVRILVGVGDFAQARNLRAAQARTLRATLRAAHKLK